MKLVLLCGNQANQIALADKIHSVQLISGIVFEQKVAKPSKKSVNFFITKLLDLTLFYAIRKSWFKLLEYYANYNLDSTIQQLTVPNINSKEAIQFIEKLQPDYVLVSGTSLIKKEVLAIKNIKGFINLHTGLSPYIKGGPNCTNWCIATNQSHLIGNTIMWLDLGIDSGNIIATELTALDGNESLLDVHKKVMDHAHCMYVEVVKKLRDNELLRNISQKDIAGGITYYTKMWSIGAKFKLLYNFYCGRYKQTIAQRDQLIKNENILTYQITDAN